MPIDTAAKRRAAAGVGYLPLTPGVTPDVNKDAFWRASVGWVYYYQLVTVPVDGINIELLWEPVEVRFQFTWDSGTRFDKIYEVPSRELGWTNSI